MGDLNGRGRGGLNLRGIRAKWMLNSMLLVVLALLLVIFAGRVYKAMALYKGQSTSLKKIFKIISTK